jgi:23S rRNA pseudouridine1911/1915/1917 synthase
MQRLSVPTATTLLPFLLDQLPSMTRTAIKERLRIGGVTINGDVVTKHDHPLRPGDAVVFGVPAPVVKRGASLRILHSDHRIVVVDKPAGMLSVASEGRGREAHVMAELGRMGVTGKLFPVHRLDRETTGVLVVGRDAHTQSFYEAHWHLVDKRYLALVQGRLSGSGTIEAPLRQDPLSLSMMVGAHAGAQSATTHWRSLGHDERHSFVEVELDTGRKHQIRAHLSHVGHPVVGDARYGDGKRSGAGMCLHARSLTLPHPEHEGRARWLSDLPAWAAPWHAHVVAAEAERDNDSRSSTPAK